MKHSALVLALVSAYSSGCVTTHTAALEGSATTQSITGVVVAVSDTHLVLDSGNFMMWEMDWERGRQVAGPTLAVGDRARIQYRLVALRVYPAGEALSDLNAPEGPVMYQVTGTLLGASERTLSIRKFTEECELERAPAFETHTPLAVNAHITVRYFMFALSATVLPRPGA